MRHLLIELQDPRRTSATLRAWRALAPWATSAGILAAYLGGGRDLDLLAGGGIGILAALLIAGARARLARH